MLNLLLALAILYAEQFQAAKGDSTSRDEIFGVSHELALMDNPQAEISRLLAERNRIDQQAFPKLWLQYQIQYMIASVTEGYGEDFTFDDAEQAFREAIKFDLKREQSILLGVMARKLPNSDQQRKESLYVKSIETCQQTKSWDCSRSYELYISYLQNRDDFAKALRYGSSSLDAEGHPSPSQEIGQIRLKGVIAVIFDSLWEPERSLKLYDEVLAFADRQKLRMTQSIVAYNKAKLLLKHEELQQKNEIIPLLELAAKLSEELKDQIGVAWAERGMGEYYLKTRAFDLAISHLESCKKKITQESAPDLYMAVYQVLSEAYLSAGRYADAKVTLRLAEQLTPESNKAAHEMLLKIRFRLEKAQGDPLKAIEYLEQAFALRGTIAEMEKRDRLEKQQTLTNLKIEEQRSVQLKAEIGVQKDKLIASQRVKNLSIGLCVVVTAMLVGLMVIFRQTKSLAEQRKKMHMILEVIEEGIVIIDSKMTLSEIFSAHLEGLVDQNLNDIKGHAIGDVLFRNSQLTEDQISMTHEVLGSSVGESLLTWEFNAHLLPNQLVFRDSGKVIDLYWQPLLVANRVHEFLLCLRNVSEKVQAQKAVESLHLKATILTEMMSVNLQRAAEFIDEIKIWGPVQGLPWTQSHTHLLNETHTYKGVARTLGLALMSSLLHNLEDVLKSSEVDSGIKHWSQDKAVDLLSVYGEVKDILRPALQGKKALSIADIERDIHLLVMDRCKENQLKLGGFVFADEWNDWRAHHLRFLSKALIHAINNSIDHGFVNPRRKGMAVAAVKIECRAISFHERLLFVLRDNGAGIDYEALRSIAAARGMDTSSVEALNEIVFEANLSTADRVCDTSGRGIGMGAIKAMVEELGGSIKIGNNPEGGACLQLTI